MGFVKLEALVFSYLGSVRLVCALSGGDLRFVYELVCGGFHEAPYLPKTGGATEIKDETE